VLLASNESGWMARRAFSCSGRRRHMFYYGCIDSTVGQSMCFNASKIHQLVTDGMQYPFSTRRSVVADGRLVYEQQVDRIIVARSRYEHQ